MLYVIVACVICVLVPWSTILTFRSFPRRPPLPGAANQLEKIVQELKQPRSAKLVPGILLAEDDTDLEAVEIWESGSNLPISTPQLARNQQENHHRPVEVRAEPGLQTVKKGTPRRLTATSYVWLNYLILPFVIGGFLAFAVLWAGLFHFLAERHAQGFLSARFLFKPVPYYGVFALPALFLGIFSIVPFVSGAIYFLLGRQRFLEYMHWDEGRVSHQFGMHFDGGLRMITHLAILVSVCSIACICLAMNWHIRFTEEAIAFKNLIAFAEEMHSYDSLEQIVVTTHRWHDQKIVAKPDLGLRFRNGQCWCTSDMIALPADPAERDRFLAFLQQKTGLPITRAHLLEDLGHW